MTLLSIDIIKSGLMKLNCLGERATSQKETMFNNRGHIIEGELLKQMYFQLESKRAVDIDGVSKEAYGNGSKRILIIL